MINFDKKDNTGDLDALPNPSINKLLLNLIKLENKLIPFIRFPFGVSTFCIVKIKSF